MPSPQTDSALAVLSDSWPSIVRLSSPANGQSPAIMACDKTAPCALLSPLDLADQIEDQTASVLLGWAVGTIVAVTKSEAKKQDGLKVHAAWGGRGSVSS